MEHTVCRTLLGGGGGGARGLDCGDLDGALIISSPQLGLWG